MSLIEDALKRARDEAARQEEAHRQGKRPWIAPAPRERGRRFGAAAAVAAIAVAAAAGTLWVLRGRHSPAVSQAAPAPAAALSRPGTPPAAAPAPLPPVRESVEVPPPAGTAGAAPEKAEPGVSARLSAKEPAAPSPAPATPPEKARPPEPPPRPAASPSLSDGRTFVRVADLPSGEKIELEGIVYSDANPVAVIGGRVLAPGAYVGDFQIVRIEESRVTLSGKGVTIYLTLF